MQDSLLNWPDSIERTPKSEREDCTKFSTRLQATRSDLRTEMDLLEVEEWRVEEVGGHSNDPGVVVRWIKDGAEYAAACDAFTTKTANLRETYLWIRETRMRAQRATETAEDAFAAAQLPSGDEPVAPERPPHTVLGVDPDASKDEINDAYREKAKEAHVDVGGSNEEMTELNKAKKAMLEDR
jgi:hypothetical protein